MKSHVQIADYVLFVKLLMGLNIIINYLRLKLTTSSTSAEGKLCNPVANLKLHTEKT